MIHTTTVNDNAVQFLTNQLGGERDTNARRFAADCERNHDGIDHVFPNAGDKVNVGLVNSADAVSSFHPPDGWKIDKVFFASSGNVIVRCAPEMEA